ENVVAAPIFSPSGSSLMYARFWIDFRLMTVLGYTIAGPEMRSFMNPSMSLPPPMTTALVSAVSAWMASASVFGLSHLNAGISTRTLPGCSIGTISTMACPPLSLVAEAREDLVGGDRQV